MEVITDVENVKSEDITEDITEEEFESNMQDYYRECDKLLFVSCLLALNEPLPEELSNEEFTKQGALAEICDHIENLEKLVNDFESPIGYLGFDLKSPAVLIAMSIMLPEVKEKFLKQLYGVYEIGKSEPYKNNRFYSSNLDRITKISFAYPDITREELPTLSSLLRHIVANPNDTMSGPFLTIRSLVDMSKVEFEDIGPNYRNILREEIEMAKRKTVANKATKVNTEEVITNTNVAEKVTVECGNNKQEFELTSNQEQKPVKETETREEGSEKETIEKKSRVGKIREIIEDRMKKIPNVVKEFSEKNKEFVEKIGEMDPFVPYDPNTGSAIKNVESWTNTSKKKSSRETNILIGLAGIAVIGGIGYLTYKNFVSGDDSAAFNNGMD